MVSNGYVPADQLVYVQGSIQLSRPTANAYDSMRSTAAKEGRRISIAAPAGGYRSYSMQVDMRARPWLYNLNPASKAGLALPGRSNHGYGTCVDVVGDLSWAISNAARWGFTRPFGAADPNHFLHDGRTATAGGSATPLPTATLPDEGVHDMKWIVVQNSDKVSLTGILYGEFTKQTFSYHPQATGAANAPFLAAEAVYAERSLNRQYVSDGVSILEDKNLASRITQLRAIAPTSGGPSGTVPTAEQIAAEVIRQQKLPGN